VGIDVASATDGVAVRRVARGSAAQRAGLAVGDVITAVAGSPVRSVREWAEASAALRAPTVPLAVRRGAERLELVLRWDGRRADLGGEGQHPHGLDRAGTRAAALDRALHLSES
jgi:S1-C subfamily serine protease